MNKRNIIVIGASSGGLEAIKQLVSGLPSDLDAAIFIVWHMSPEMKGVVPEVINKLGTIKAVQAKDKEPIEFNRIYVAPPDRHLLITNGVINVSRGPKENRFRPAVDPLFRSAAHHYGSRVIGIVLSGALDDGSAGLWTIKSRGGVAIVQDPAEAEFPSMPNNALAANDVDYCLPLAGISSLLATLVEEPAPAAKEFAQSEQKKTALEVQAVGSIKEMDEELVQLGEPSVYTCPDCHGVLSEIREGDIKRYRCHTGHAFSAGSLLTSITEKIETTLWDAVRGVEESIFLLNHLGDHFAEVNDPKLAAVYFKKANEAEKRAQYLRHAIWAHEQLNPDIIRQEAHNSGNGTALNL